VAVRRLRAHLAGGARFIGVSWVDGAKKRPAQGGSFLLMVSVVSGAPEICQPLWARAEVSTAVVARALIVAAAVESAGVEE
jgi:hypothetical protein